MDALRDIYNHAAYKTIIANELITRKKIQIIDLIKELERLVRVHYISGKLVVNRLKEDHFKECSQAYIDADYYDCTDSCVCWKIWNLESQITVLLDELKTNNSWMTKMFCQSGGDGML